MVLSSRLLRDEHLSIAAISYMMASGISAATAVKVGNQYGLNSRAGVRSVAFSSFIMVIAFMSISAIIFFIGKNTFPTFFSFDLEVINIAATLLMIAGLFQLSDGVQVVALGALRGMKDVKVPTAITLVAYWLIGLPTSYLFGFVFDWGLKGIWYGLVLGLTTAAIMLFLRFNYVSKKI